MRITNIIATLLICFSFAFSGEWVVDKDSKNLVKFTSSVVSVLEFDGITDEIDGYLYWEGETMFEKNTQMHFEVNLNAIDTDNGKRDRDMRDVLETDKWPYTIFDGTISKFEPLQDKDGYDVTVSGKISIHGKEKEIEVPGTITKEDGKLHVVANFSVFLKDYDIEAPSLVAFVKVAEEIKLHLDFYLVESE